MGTESESPEPDCQKQFQAAVNVIQNLPKNGSYRPSYEEMLRFYSYYKQATVGPCLVPRPGFWDPIGRYKWDAWNSLGKMSREEAMSAYITEMKLVAQKVGRGGCRPLSVPRLSARWPAPASSLTPIVFPAHRYPSGAVPPPLPVSGSCLGTRWRRAIGQEQGGGGPAQGGRRTVVRGASLSPLTLLPTQVIDTVPLGEVAGDMFGYFEPLYQVIPDMPRPPETFLRRITGWKEQVLNGDAGAAPEPPRLPKEPAPPSPESQPPRDQDSEVFCDSLEQLEPELVWAEQGSAHGGELDARNSPEPPAGKGKVEGSPPGSQELDAWLVGTVRALQESMRDVQGRLRSLEGMPGPPKQVSPLRRPDWGRNVMVPILCALSSQPLPLSPCLPAHTCACSREGCDSGCRRQSQGSEAPPPWKGGWERPSFPALTSLCLKRR
uniref:Acyl-CoA binding domain containing 4 n=1 Tax=Sus scrofa TaxID=9823 RepID=A0A8D1PST8_PIG